MPAIEEGAMFKLIGWTLAALFVAQLVLTILPLAHP
jgi:hypothetical protein